MKQPEFDDKGRDATSFAPFELINCLETEWHDVRLTFCDWSWIKAKYKTDTIDDYYLNGYGIEGLVKAVLFDADIDLESADLDFNSEGDACNIHFKDLQLASRAAELASIMISTPQMLQKMIAIAREEGFED